MNSRASSRGVESLQGARLLVLGAGLFQLAGITRAIELGCEVTTTDNVLENVGHQLSHQSFNVSTTDVDQILELVDSLQIDGVVTFASDIATNTVAAAREHLRLPGPNRGPVSIMSNKATFRTWQRQTGFSGPDFVITNKSPSRWGGELTLPIVIKPVDASGSKGVGIAKSSDDVIIVAQKALAASRSGTIILEDFLPGREVGGDIFLVDGEIIGGCVTNKYLDRFTVVGHSVPSSLTTREQSAVLGLVAETCRAIGVFDGPVNFDVIINNDVAELPVVLEMSPRTGGNGIPELVELSTGFDIYEATIKHALGLSVPRSPSAEIRNCGSALLGPRFASSVTRTSHPGYIGHREQTLRKIWFRHQVVDSLTHSCDTHPPLGYCIFDCVSDSDFLEALSIVRSGINSNVVENKDEGGHGNL